MNIKSFSILLLLGCSYTLSAQIDSLQTINLKPIEVSATRISGYLLETTWSVTKLDFKEQQDQMQQLSFSEYVQGVPGLFALNSNNFSQDLRVSIRGFGARSAFGIRGIKILVDGIPETTPDGQGQIDNLALGSIAAVEVIRGPSSLLYGNASGGIISIETTSDIEKNYLKPIITYGSYGMQNYQIEAGVKKNKTTLSILANKIKTNGYRRQSGFESSVINARVKHQFSDQSEINVLLNYTDSPVAEDAGGLNLESVQSDRLQARDRNVTFKTEEAVKQFKTGISFQHQLNSKFDFSTYGFYASRDFYARLPFGFGGVVALDRSYFGQGAQLKYKGGKHLAQMGYSWASQSDLRERFVNDEGEQGALTLNQEENFNTLGFYVLDEVSLGKLKLAGGLRYDSNRLAAEDRLLTNGDDSGDIALNAWSSSLGVNYKISTQHYVFASLGTSFETPVLSELSANPNGAGGFNARLSAQEALNKEIGYRFFNSKSQWEVVLFNINTANDLVPYELEAFPSRTFYRNAGKTKRNGIEFAYTRQNNPNLKTKISYTYSDFSYDSFTTPNGDFTGKQLPGIPKHMASLVSTFTKNGWNIALNNRFQGRLFANDSNEVEEKAFLVSNLNLSYRIEQEKLVWVPFFGVNNLWNTIYNDNIRVNAFGGRYYEPAPTRHIFGGVRLTL